MDVTLAWVLSANMKNKIMLLPHHILNYAKGLVTNQDTSASLDAAAAAAADDDGAAAAADDDDEEEEEEEEDPATVLPVLTSTHFKLFVACVVFFYKHKRCF